MNDSTSSTDKLPAFLGGALLRDFTTLWDQQRSADEDEDSPVIFQWQHTTEYGQLAHAFTFNGNQQETSGLPIFTSEALKTRILCHVLLDTVPDEGLTEVYETIGEAVKFYGTPLNIKTLPEITIQRAKTGRIYNREIIELSETE